MAESAHGSGSSVSSASFHPFHLMLPLVAAFRAEALRLLAPGDGKLREFSSVVREACAMTLPKGWGKDPCLGKGGYPLSLAMRAWEAWPREGEEGDDASQLYLEEFSDVIREAETELEGRIGAEMRRVSVEIGSSEPNQLVLTLEGALSEARSLKLLLAPIIRSPAPREKEERETSVGGESSIAGKIIQRVSQSTRPHVLGAEMARGMASERRVNEFVTRLESGIVDVATEFDDLLRDDPLWDITVLGGAGSAEGSRFMADLWNSVVWLQGSERPRAKVEGCKRLLRDCCHQLLEAEGRLSDWFASGRVTDESGVLYRDAARSEIRRMHGKLLDLIFMLVQSPAPREKEELENGGELDGNDDLQGG